MLKSGKFIMNALTETQPIFRPIYTDDVSGKKHINAAN